MKTAFKIFILIVVPAILGFLGYKTIRKLQVRKQTAKQIQMLPDFKFYSMNEHEFSRKDLILGMPVVIFHFSPDCENCQYETSEIMKNINFFKQTQLVMISSKAKEKIEEFISYFKLNEHPQITVLHDRDNKFFDFFGMGMSPLTMIYNGKQQLVKYYKGEVNVEAIQKAMAGGN